MRYLLLLAFVILSGCVETTEPDEQGRTVAPYSVQDRARDLVASSLSGHLGIRATDLASMDYPRGDGVFVYSPETRYSGTERLIVWVVVGNVAYPINGVTKGITPDLPWPRDALESTWSNTNLNAYSVSDVLEIVFRQ